MLVHVVAVALAAFTWPVLGGSRAWESPLRHELQLDRRRFEALPVDEAGYAIRNIASNNTIGKINKRWFGIRPGSGNWASYLWPDKTISYCFDTIESRDKLEEPLELAFKMWYAGFEDGSSGLNSVAYKYTQVTDPGTKCTRYSKRDKTLVISHDNDEGIMATTTGVQPLNQKYPEYLGPTMILSTRDDLGQLNVVANIAHEVGHAWGLLHEHQNPLFWSIPYGTTTDPGLQGKVFDNNFDCSALTDYYTVRSKIVQRKGAGPEADQIMKDVCQNQLAAKEYGFSAYDWLPVMTDYISKNIPSGGADYKHVDWDSIMLYPSGAGGRGPARPPTNPSEDPEEYDQRTPVLLRNDGAKIHTNAIPSKGDIAGIRYLYEDARIAGATADTILPNDKRSKWYTNLKKNFALKKDKKCDNPN
ncbi:hypothetical protein E8E14_007705 [Neopestalotiopsis sp. 37M]|nr:hypothetical protein E8E14_007705 [Neopestalotiopsis sp. 37M]